MTDTILEQRQFKSRKTREVSGPCFLSLSEIIAHFKKAYAEVESMKKCLSYADKSKEESENAGEYMLRSQIVMAYSAFDLFMHEILFHGFQLMQRGKLDRSSGYLRFKKEKEDRECSFVEQYKETYGHASLISSNWRDALNSLDLNSITIAELYNERQNIGSRGNLALQQLLNELDIKASRRNNLVHSYDYDIISGRQSEIDVETAEEFTGFIWNVVSSVCEYTDKEWNRSMNTASDNSPATIFMGTRRNRTRTEL